MRCPICNLSNWEKVTKPKDSEAKDKEYRNWIRCRKCGYLETTMMSNRYCRKCGIQLGKYAKLGQTICANCREARLIQDVCSTPGCNNIIWKRKRVKYCSRCEKEIGEWSGKNPNLWKLVALFILKEPVSILQLFQQLAKLYPEITYCHLKSWMRQQQSIGSIRRIQNGIYTTSIIVSHKIT